MNTREIEGYNTVLQHAINCVTDNAGRNSIVFRVPTKMMGCPEYVLKRCMAYIIKYFRNMKYTVSYKPPHFLILKTNRSNEIPQAQQKKRGRKKKPIVQKTLHISSPELVDILNSELYRT